MVILALFDIDGTLLRNNKAHVDAFEVAFKEVYGVDANVFMIECSGMTDQLIIAEVLKKIGVSEEVIKAKMPTCLEVLAETFARLIKVHHVTVLGGVPELLSTLKSSGVKMGLVTGNLEVIAFGKLSTVGLDKYFELGGFGSDAVQRVEMLRIAIAMAKKKYGTVDKVFLVGDTPRDIAAGKDGGVITVAVCTGRFSEEMLKLNTPDFLFPNLADTKAVMKVLLGPQ